MSSAAVRDSIEGVTNGEVIIQIYNKYLVE